jgi:hypothetical protein
MKIRVLEERVYNVPPEIENLVQTAVHAPRGKALQTKDIRRVLNVEIDELICDCEAHGGLHGVKTLSVEIVKARKRKETKHDHQK